MPKTVQEIMCTPMMYEAEHRAWILEATDEQLNEYILCMGNEGLNRMALSERERRHFSHLLKPHWTMTPGFIVGFLAMVFAAIAAWPTIQAWIQFDAPSNKAASSPPLQSNLVPVIPAKIQISPPTIYATPNTNLLKK